MKKQANQLIALVITLVMLISMLPATYIPVLAEEVSDQTETPVETQAPEEVLPHCVCGGAAAGVGDHICSSVEWTPWNDGERYNAGNYYLTENVTLTTAISVTNLSLDLNGHTLTLVGPTTTSKQIFNMTAGGTLNVCDSVGGGSITAYATASGTQGAIVNTGNGGYGSTINLFSGTFDASTIPESSQQGSAFNIIGATLNLYGGTIIGTHTTNHGGAVYVNIYNNNQAGATGGFFNMYGGEVYGGSSNQGSGNLFVGGNAGKDDQGNAVAGAVNLLGGTIYGSVMTTGKTISIGGSIKILETKKDGTPANCGLWVKDANTVTVLALNEDAIVYLDKNTNSNAAVFGTDVAAQTYGQIRVGQYTKETVELTYEDVAYVLSGSNLIMGEGRYGCLCGQETHIGDCNGGILVWLPWTKTDAMPNGFGNYYLTAPVTSTAFKTVTANKILNVDLNGFTVTGSEQNVYNLQNNGETLNITDTAGGGIISATDKNVVNVTALGSSFCLYGGTLQSTITTVNANGGNSKNTCSINIYGGTVVGGSATWGGALYINNGASLNITGGVVYGGTAATNGDNIFIGGSAGTSYITGGTVYGGPNKNAVVTTGGLLYIGGSAKVYDYLNDEAKTAAKGVAFNAEKIKILPLNADAEIRFMGAAGTKVAALDSTTENKNYAQLLGAGSELVALPNTNGELVLTVGKLHCLCAQAQHVGDCTGEVLLWTPWSKNSLPIDSGNYYLTENVVNGGQASVKANQIINLDLNGKSFAPARNPGSAVGNYYRPYVMDNAGAVLNITDSVGGGVLYGGVRGDSGVVVRVNKAAALNLYGGTLDGSTLTQTSTDSVRGAVQINHAEGQFHMYGGQIIGIDSVTKYVNIVYDSTNKVITSEETSDVVVKVVGSAVDAVSGAVVELAGGQINGTVYVPVVITWNIDGVVTTQIVNRGDAVSHSTPVKEDADGFSYTFVGWSLRDGGEVLSELPAASENVTYYAVFQAQKMSATVTWTNWDGTVLKVEEVAMGETPVYGDADPTRPADSQYVYVFKGWTPEVSAVTGNVTYKAGYEWMKTVAQIGDTYYYGFETAFNAADGKTMVLLADVTTNKTTTILAGKDITIDLNGHSISAAENFHVSSTIFNVQGKLTICDSVGTGTVDASSVTASVTGGLVINSNVATGEVVLQGGKLIGGVTSNFGGAVYINSGAKFTMTGGFIVGGKASDGSDANKGDSLFVGGNTATVVELLGGTIYGGVRANGSTIRVGGSVKILQTLENGESAAYGMLLSGSNFVTALTLNDDALIYVDKNGAPSVKVVAFAEGAEAKEYPQICVGDFTKTNGIVAYSDIVLLLDAVNSDLRMGQGRYGCLCGQEEHIGDCNGELLLWKPWSGNKLPAVSGNYYLTESVVNGGQAAALENQVINLDLNGHSFAPAQNSASTVGNYFRPIVLEKEGIVLNITDSVGGGVIYAGVRGDSGMAINITAAATLNLYGGTLDASVVEECGAASIKGGAVNLKEGSNGTFNMYGGKIVGISSEITDGADKVIPVSGSAVFAAANTTVNLAGGEIQGDVYIQMEITWIVEGVSSTTYVEKGTVPTKAKPVKESVDGYAYTFIGWSLTENGEVLETLPEAQANATYYAVFTGELVSAAKVGDTYYASLGAAVNATQSGTVVLLQDVTVDSTVTVSEGKEIVLDLNGKTISAGENLKASNSMIYVIGKLTICDSVGTGSVDASSVNATTGGAAIKANSATAEIVLQSGKIIGGTTSDFGGAVYINGGAKFTMNGGSISGGNAAQKGNTLFVGGSAGEVKLLGGSISGGAYSTGNAVSVGGSIKIGQEGYGLKVDGANYITVLALNEDAEVYLDKSTGLNNAIAVFGEGVEAAAYSQVKAGSASVEALLNNVEGSGIHMIDGKLYLTAGQWDCVCRQDEHIGDCSGEKNIFWRAWTDASAIPTSGSYYLTVDIVNAKQAAVGGTLNLDLNGHSVRVGQNPGAAVEGGTYNSYRVLYMSDDTDVLNITDSVGGGVLYAGARHDAGHIVYILDCEATFNLYAGTLSGEEIVDTNSARGNTSGVVYSTEGGTFNMYGGKIIGWNGLTHASPDALAEKGYAFVSGTGASVTFAGTFNMYDGIIEGGNAIPGNAGSTGDGGNVFMMEGSTFNMYGGTITGGKAQYGGNVFICAGATYNYVGGTIENGTALEFGDDVFCVEDSELIYTITFVDEAGEELWSQQLYRGSTPDFDGVLTKAPEGVTTYEHIGWTPGVKVVTQDVTYAPVFEATVHDFLVDQWSVTLGDDLDVNFLVNVNEELAQTASMQITVGNGKPVVYQISELEQNENGAYVFVVEIAAAQMADSITLQMINGEELGESFSYSVEQYAEAVLADETLESYHAMVKEMLNYGAKAQAYFEYNTENVIGDQVDLTETGAENVPETWVNAIQISGKEEGIAFYGASLVFRSKIAVRFYFTGDLFGYSVDGTVGQKNDMYYIEIADIDPQELDEVITVSVGGLSVSYSPMNYVVRMHATGSDTLKSLLKALYNYYLAAEKLA